jgi:hypothetical protein
MTEEAFTWMPSIAPAARVNGGNFRWGCEFRLKPELSMQAVVDRVLRALTLRQPISDEEAEAVRREATEFAIDLLAKYREQLAHRSLREAAEH